MSYVVVTNIPGYLPVSDPITADSLDDAREVAAEQVTISRDAVLAPEEDAGAAGWNDFEDEAQAIAEEGGTIGPLPDGSVVQVLPVADRGGGATIVLHNPPLGRAEPGNQGPGVADSPREAHEIESKGGSA